MLRSCHNLPFLSKGEKSSNVFFSPWSRREGVTDSYSVLVFSFRHIVINGAGAGAGAPVNRKVVYVENNYVSIHDIEQKDTIKPLTLNLWFLNSYL